MTLVPLVEGKMCEKDVLFLSDYLFQLVQPGMFQQNEKQKQQNQTAENSEAPSTAASLPLQMFLQISGIKSESS